MLRPDSCRCCYVGRCMEPELVGIFGGTFDPPHLGHELLLDMFIRRFSPDLTIVCPTSAPPYKQRPAADYLRRVAMCELMALRHERTIVSSLEFLNGERFAYRTLARFAALFSG